MSVIVEGGVARRAVVSVQQLLLGSQGVYTTARTLQDRDVFLFEAHVKRLCDSVSLAEGYATVEYDEVREVLENALELAFLEKESGPSKITVLLRGEEGSVRDRMVVVVDKMPERKRGGVCKAVVGGEGRETPKAKDVRWVGKRVGLEEWRKREDDVDEVLLFESGGERVLEGTQSNFFAVTQSSSSPHSSPLLSSLVLETAGSGMLEGTMRTLLLTLPPPPTTQLIAPLLSNAPVWKGAILTSTSRLLLPLTHILVPPDIASRIGLQWKEGDAEGGGKVLRRDDGMWVREFGDVKEWGFGELMEKFNQHLKEHTREF